MSRSTASNSEDEHCAGQNTVRTSFLLAAWRLHEERLGVAQREDYSIHCENLVVHVFPLGFGFRIGKLSFLIVSIVVVCG
jgi:hypothetical protein